MSQSALDVATALAGAGLGLTLGTNVFWGKVRESDDNSGVPSQAVFCLPRLSVEPLHYLDGSISPQYKQPVVQIMVRSNPQDFAGGYALARSIVAALHDIPPSGYFACRIVQIDPLPIGETSQGEQLFSLNCQLRIVE